MANSQFIPARDTEFLAWAQKKGVSWVTLEAVPENRIGVPFWKKKGFRTVMIHMRRRL